MSAFIVDKATIDLIIGALPDGIAADLTELARTTHTITAAPHATDRDILGAILWETNLAAVAYRYHDDDLNTLPGPLELTLTNTPVIGLKGIDYTYDPAPAHAAGIHHHDLGTTWPTTTVTAVASSISCLEYQTSEIAIPALMDTILHAARKHALAALPGFDEAPWGWTDSDTATGLNLRP